MDLETATKDLDEIKVKSEGGVRFSGFPLAGRLLGGWDPRSSCGLSPWLGSC